MLVCGKVDVASMSCTSNVRVCRQNRPPNAQNLSSSSGFTPISVATNDVLHTCKPVGAGAHVSSNGVFAHAAVGARVGEAFVDADLAVAPLPRACAETDVAADGVLTAAAVQTGRRRALVHVDLTVRARDPAIGPRAMNHWSDTFMSSRWRTCRARHSV